MCVSACLNFDLIFPPDNSVTIERDLVVLRENENGPSGRISTPLSETGGSEHDT